MDIDIDIDPNTKPWYQSKTVQLAALTIGMSAMDALNSGLGWRQIVGASLGAGFGVLRLVTTKPIGK
jgi:hypothetical protein